MRAELLEAVLKSQQGELDALKMYNELAKVVPESDREVFKRLAAEEGHHAAVFFNYSKEKLEPNDRNAKLLVKLYKIIGKKALYPLIAKGEYMAAKRYEHLIADLPEIRALKDDEIRHGDTVKSLLK